MTKHSQLLWRAWGTTLARIALVVVAIALIVPPMSAQLSYSSGRPVWPAFEGWMQNDDGSADVLFGYMK
jgi:hypothetical protein